MPTKVFISKSKDALYIPAMSIFPFSREGYIGFRFKNKEAHGKTKMSIFTPSKNQRCSSALGVRAREAGGLQ